MAVAKGITALMYRNRKFDRSPCCWYFVKVRQMNRKKITLLRLITGLAGAFFYFGLGRHFNLAALKVNRRLGFFL
jgi:hypothetical protein